jgi:hypothetical protein
MSNYSFGAFGDGILSNGLLEGVIEAARDPNSSDHRAEYMPVLQYSMQAWKNYNDPSLSVADAVNANQQLLEKMNKQLEKYGPESFIPAGANAEQYKRELAQSYVQLPESRGEFSNKELAAQFQYAGFDAIIALDRRGYVSFRGSEPVKRASMSIVLADLNLRCNASHIADADRVRILETLRDSLTRGIEHGLLAHPNMTVEALEDRVHEATQRYRDQLAKSQVIKENKTPSADEINAVVHPVSFESDLGERAELAYKKDAMEFALKSQNMSRKERLRVYENYLGYWVQASKTMNDEDILRGISTDDLTKYVDKLESELARREALTSHSLQKHAVHEK